MNKRNIITGSAVVAGVALVVGLHYMRQHGAEHAIRRTIIKNQTRANETAAALQRADRITVVLCGVGSQPARC